MIRAQHGFLSFLVSKIIYIKIRGIKVSMFRVVLTLTLLYISAIVFLSTAIWLFFREKVKLLKDDSREALKKEWDDGFYLGWNQGVENERNFWMDKEYRADKMIPIDTEVIRAIKTYEEPYIESDAVTELLPIVYGRDVRWERY